MVTLRTRICGQITLQMAAYVKAIQSSAPFLLQISESYHTFKKNYNYYSNTTKN